MMMFPKMFFAILWQKIVIQDCAKQLLVTPNSDDCICDQTEKQVKSGFQGTLRRTSNRQGTAMMWNRREYD